MNMVAIVVSRIDFMENIFAYGIYERYAKPRWQPSNKLKSEICKCRNSLNDETLAVFLFISFAFLTFFEQSFQ